MVTSDVIYTPNLVGSGQFGTCGACGLQPTPEGHDGCLGTLPDTNIMNACCGHGCSGLAYIQYWEGDRIAGDIAIAEIKRLLGEPHENLLLGNRYSTRKQQCNHARLA